MAHKGISIAELLVSMAAVAVTLVVFADFMNQSGYAHRAKTRRASCMSNMKQIGMAVAQYAQDYEESLPYSGSGHDWPDESLVYFPQIIMPYAQNAAIFKCPDDPFAEHGALYEALRQAGRSPSAPKLPTTYYYFYDFYHPEMSTRHVPPCTPGPLRAAKMAEVIHPGSKAMMVCILSDQYVSSRLAHGSGSPRQPSDSLLFADCHFKFVPIASLADIACFPEHNLDWGGVGAKDVK